MSKKYCPLMVGYVDHPEKGKMMTTCLEEACAWWINLEERCAVNMLGYYAMILYDRMD